MKNVILITGFLLIFAACNKDSNSLPTISNPNPYLNKYTGTFSGEFSESNNGVDTNGVFKTDTAYTMTLKLTDGGIYPIVFRGSTPRSTFTITKGPLVMTSIPVDDSGRFAIFAYNRNISGRFVNDSLYMSSKALNGSYNYPQWFEIQKLAFAGKKEF